MFNYKAYEPGQRTAYPVTQIRWEGKKKHIAFNGAWHKEDECIICTGTGTNDSDGNEIYMRDILQLDIDDVFCGCKGRVGVVNFSGGKFYWSTPEGYGCYLLSGKRWINLGNTAYLNDVLKYYTNEQIKRSTKIRTRINNESSISVLVEKYKPSKSVEAPYFNLITYKANKQSKKLLHQYKNYLKIKNMIDTGVINPKILDSNLGSINSDSEIVKNNIIS